MRSPAARLTLGAVAWIAFGAAAYLIVQTEQQLTRRREALQLFDSRAKEAATTLADAQTAQHAFLVPAQGQGNWAATIDALLKNAAASLDELRQTSSSDEARQALVSARDGVTQLRGVDNQAREYVSAAQPLMAADIVVTEGLEIAAAAGRQLETARMAEHVGWDAAEAGDRRVQATSAAAAAGLSALIIALLAVARPARKAPAAEPLRPAIEPIRVPDLRLDERPTLHDAPTVMPVAPMVNSALAAEPVPMLKAAVGVCIELNRARDGDELNRLLAQAAQAIDASGLVVWCRPSEGAAVRPVLAHGYSAPALTRMPPLSQDDDNAAAVALRTETLQVVPTRPGLSSGALAVPMLARAGCIGVLTAELNNGGEASENVQAIAGILAAQLAGILGDSVSLDSGMSESRIASA